MRHGKSDVPIVVKKWGNACGAKGDTCSRTLDGNTNHTQRWNLVITGIERIAKGLNVCLANDRMKRLVRETRRQASVGEGLSTVQG